MTLSMPRTTRTKPNMPTDIILPITAGAFVVMVLPIFSEIDFSCSGSGYMSGMIVLYYSYG